MRTVTYRLADLNRAVIPLGFVGENQHTRVIFDAAKVFAEYPAAVPALTVQPPQGTSYPAVVVRDGDYVQFDVSDSDLIHAGTGELQLAFVQDTVHVRTFITRTRIDRSIVPTGEIPEPLEDFLEEASAAVAAIPQEVADGVAEGFGAVTAEAETLAPGSSATAEFNTETKVLTIGVPEGERGQTGPAGADGAPGKDGKDGKDGTDGKDGKDGKDGTDGHTPVKGTDYWTAEDQAEIVAAAAAAAAGEVIDDTAGDGVTNKTWSADKLSDLNGAISAKYTKPQNGIPASDLESGVIPAVPVTDVQVNGTSVLSQGVANVPIADSTNPGVVIVRNGNDGLSMDSFNRLNIARASSAQIKSGDNGYRAIAPYSQHESVFYALAKLAGADMASLSGETVGVYPEAQKIAIQKMLGIYEAPWELIREDTGTNATEANIEIAVDSNGNPFELTDIRLVFHTPTQETAASVTNSGRVKFFFGANNSDTLYNGAYTQAAGATGRTSYFNIEQHDGMIERTFQKNATNNGEQNIISNVNVNLSGITRWEYGSKSYIKIAIECVTGTWQYKLYGKRKWT